MCFDTPPPPKFAVAAPMHPYSSLVGAWAGWSCAHSVSGMPLPVPADLCLAGMECAGFRELTTELYLELQAPATGVFVERSVTKLMPNGALPVQRKTGRLAQLHAVGRAVVQDSHLEGDASVVRAWPELSAELATHGSAPTARSPSRDPRGSGSEHGPLGPSSEAREPLRSAAQNTDLAAF